MIDAAGLDAPRYRRVHLVVLFIVPLIELAANPSAFVNPGGNITIDAWVNTGFFLTWPNLLERFGFTYYSTRLSWLLPGSIAHRLLPPLAANYALHLTAFFALLWVTYRFLESGAGRHVAMLGTLLVAWSPAVLGAIGWDYVDGAGMVYLIATLLCIERAVNGSHDTAWSFAIGCAATCLLIANLALVLLLPACGTFLIFRAGASRWRWILRSLLSALAGAIVTLLVFAALNRSFGGHWLFFAPSLQFAAAMSATANPWRNPGFPWMRAVWLVVPCCVAVGALLTVAAAPIGRPTFSRAVQLAFLTAVATWVSMDAVLHSALLQHWFYASYLVPLALVALPLQTGELTVVRRWRSAVSVELAVCATLALAHVGFLRYGVGFWNRIAALPGPPHTFDRLAVITTVVTAVGIFAVVWLRYARRSVVQGAVVTAGLAFLCAAPHLWQGAGDPEARARFQTVAEAHRYIGKHIDRSALRLWYHSSPQDAPPFRALASTYLWGWVLINEEMPRLTGEQAATLRPDTRLVFFIQQQAELDDARAALKRFGWEYSIVTEERFGADHQACTVVIGALTRAMEGS